MAETARPQGTASSTPHVGQSKASGYLVALAIFGSALQGIALPSNLLPVDVIFVVILGITTVPLLTKPDLAARRFRLALPFLGLLFIGQILSLLGKGLSGTALLDMGKILLPVVVFFGVWLLLSRQWRGQVLAIRTVQLTGLFVALDTLFVGGLRASGTFGNPDYTAHFLACVVTVLWVLPSRTVTRVMLTATCLAAIYRTGSFGAALLIASAAAYWIWSRSTRLEWSARMATRVALILLVLVSAPFIYRELSTAKFQGDNAISSQRLNRSASTRLQLWSEGWNAYQSHPLGVGVRGFVSPSAASASPQGYNELHNDALKFLVETGPLALLAAIGIIVIVWRSGRAGGPTRVLLAGLIASAMVREVWSFRHAWVMLAVVAAWETTHARPRAPDRVGAAGQQGP